MEFSFKINGLRELNKELKALPQDFRDRSLNNATLKATQVIRDEAVSLVPKDTENLARAIRSQKQKSGSSWISKYQVNINPRGKVTSITRGRNHRSNSTYYSKFLEEGTRKMSPRPFMRPAFDSKKEQAVRVFKEVLSKKISFYQRKLQRVTK